MTSSIRRSSAATSPHEYGYPQRHSESAKARHSQPNGERYLIQSKHYKTSKPMHHACRKNSRRRSPMLRRNPPSLSTKHRKVKAVGRHRTSRPHQHHQTARQHHAQRAPDFLYPTFDPLQSISSMVINNDSL